MPPKELMTWVPRQKRWLKKYKGKIYSVSARQLKTPPTKEASRYAANEWWGQKQVEFDQQAQGIVQSLPFAIERATEMADWYQRNGRPEDAQRLREDIHTWQEAVATGESHPRDLKFLIEMSDGGKAAWAERLRGALSTPTENTVSAHIDDFLKDRQTEQSQGRITLGTLSTLTHRLNVFRRWVQPGTAVQSLNAIILRDFHRYLSQEVAEGRMSSSHARGAMGAAKRFIRSRCSPLRRRKVSWVMSKAG